VGRSGQVHKLHSAIDAEEGQFLYQLIRNDPTIVRTLEIGCAFGLSSLAICSALEGREGASHTIIDPFQNTEWDGVGTKNLEEAGLGFFNLIEAKSEFALPRLLETLEGRFDFVLVDGWHTFDHTLVDCFYATRLLRVQGYLAIDDVLFSSVRRVVDFLSSYPCYELHGAVVTPLKASSWGEALIRRLIHPVRRPAVKILSRPIYRRICEERPARMVALKKVGDDSRNWNWHDESF
jgi:predicted O-methyltransferase YrrM